MKDIELAWAAGLFDGEGCIYVDKRNGLPQISINQVDREVLDRFQRAVGAGKVIGSYTTIRRVLIGETWVGVK